MLKSERNWRVNTSGDGAMRLLQIISAIMFIFVLSNSTFAAERRGTSTGPSFICDSSSGVCKCMGEADCNRMHDKICPGAVLVCYAIGKSTMTCCCSKNDNALCADGFDPKRGKVFKVAPISPRQQLQFQQKPKEKQIRVPPKRGKMLKVAPISPRQQLQFQQKPK